MALYILYPWAQAVDMTPGSFMSYPGIFNRSASEIQKKRRS
jgi:hypothetical protein